MRICVITPNYPLYSGEGEATAGLFVYDFAHELRNQGHEVYVFTQDRKGNKEIDKDVPIKYFNWTGSGESKKLGKLRFFNPIDVMKILHLIYNGRKELLKFVYEKKIEHCIAMWAIPSGYFARHVKNKLNIPYSVWALGSDIWKFKKNLLLKNMLKKILRDANYLFADGIELAKTVENFSGSKCHFIPSARTLPTSSNIQPKIDSSKINFLYIGRFEKEKGLDILIEAMHLMIDEGFEAYLYAFGGGTQKKELLRSINAHPNLENNVFLDDYASANTCVSYLKACKCLVIPSRIESIPIVLSDALKLGTPVIVSDVGDMGHLVREYEVGIVVPTENPLELKNALILFSKEDRNAYEKNIEKLSDQFDLKIIVKKFLANIQLAAE